MLIFFKKILKKLLHFVSEKSIIKKILISTQCSRVLTSVKG